MTEPERLLSEVWCSLAAWYGSRGAPLRRSAPCFPRTFWLRTDGIDPGRPCRCSPPYPVALAPEAAGGSLRKSLSPRGLSARGPGRESCLLPYRPEWPHPNPFSGFSRAAPVSSLCRMWTC